MALLGEQEKAYQQRREATLKLRAESPKTPGQVGLGMKSVLFQPSRPGYFTEENMSNTNMLRAKCPRLAGRTTVVGNTVFHFNAEGVCNKINEGYALYDFETLCAQNGVTRLGDVDAAPVVAPVEQPAAEPIVEEAAPLPPPPIIPDPPVEEKYEAAPEPVVSSAEAPKDERSSSDKKKSKR